MKLIYNREISNAVKLRILAKFIRDKSRVLDIEDSKEVAEDIRKIADRIENMEKTREGLKVILLSLFIGLTAFLAVMIKFS